MKSSFCFERTTLAAEGGEGRKGEESHQEAMKIILPGMMVVPEEEMGPDGECILKVNL